MPITDISTWPRPLAAQAHNALSEQCVPHRQQLTAENYHDVHYYRVNARCAL